MQYMSCNSIHKIHYYVICTCSCIIMQVTDSNFSSFDQVTSKMDQKQYWIGDENKYQYRSIEKFAESFHSSYLPRTAKDDLCGTNNSSSSFWYFLPCIKCQWASIVS
ncbi:unnamed protein product [Triticum turgidum subsp. durum]|uniref:Uncharacterized protein n=1 Tax=Triticum turgidum subsp. durum TaxID=4567 RepID=A0A9R0ZZ42_TRITD|nr:unnamed protein product [Triticum turgidum subsp. durum]